MKASIIGTGVRSRLMATSLVKSGIRNLSLIGHNRYENHDVAAGYQKIKIIPFEVSQMAAIRQIANSDLIISTVDDDGARLIAGVISNAYNRPLLDVSYGGEKNNTGTDIRLILPSENRCILCFGNLTRIDELDQLTRLNKKYKPSQIEPIVVSHNSLGVQIGVNLIEYFMSGRITESIFLKLEYHNSSPKISKIDVAKNYQCRVCQQVGTEDKILDGLPQLIRKIIIEKQIA